MRKKYLALNTISFTYNVLGVLVVVIGLITLFSSSSSVRLDEFIIALVLIVTLVAIAEGIKVFLAIESNSRATQDALKTTNEKLDELIVVFQKVSISTSLTAKKSSSLANNISVRTKISPEKLKQLISSLYKSGMTPEEISNDLTKEGLQPPNNKPSWTISIVESVLEEAMSL